MNYFLILLILGLGGSGYYEYTLLQQRSAEDQRQIGDLGSKIGALHDLSSKIDALQSENKKLEDDEARLAKGVTDAQAEVADVTKQTQSALAEIKTETLQGPNAQNPVKASPPNSNDLGTITTLDGKTFKNCQLLKVEADGIVVNHSAGIMKIMYGLMQPDMQKKFGYDPKQAAGLTEAQIQFQEQQRQAAAKASGN